MKNIIESIIKVTGKTPIIIGDRGFINSYEYITFNIKYDDITSYRMN